MSVSSSEKVEAVRPELEHPIAALDEGYHLARQFAFVLARLDRQRKR